MVKDFFSKDKKIYDSVHGFIRFGTTVRSLIDSTPFQRLHYIHQLGIAYLVYPGATHTRFEHSLGVMELATRIFYNLCKTARPDMLDFIPRKGSPEYHYWRKVLRIAALCHDLGHLPFSHVAEKDLLPNQGHEWLTYQIIQSQYLDEVFEPIQGELSQIFPERNVREDVCKLAVGEKKWVEITTQSFTPWEKVMSDIITGDFLGADRIDYLLRDSKSTGVAYGFFDYEQLIEMIRILPCPENKMQNLSLGIHENGLESCEALLLARHFMHRRVYQYSSVKAYNFHLRQFLKILFKSSDFEDLDRFLEVNDTDVICGLSKAAKDKDMPGHEEAKRIVYRKHRFKAMPIPYKIPEKELKRICQKIGIPSSAFAWEHQKPNLTEEALSFPVSRSHLSVESANECSELLSKIASIHSNWIYFSPDFEMPILQAIENLRKM